MITLTEWWQYPVTILNKWLTKLTMVTLSGYSKTQSHGKNKVTNYEDTWFFFSLGWTCVGKSKKIILKNIFITLIRAMLLKVIQKNLLNSRPN